MITVILICTVILTVYGLSVWGILKFNRYQSKKTTIRIIDEFIKRKEFTEKQGEAIKRLIFKDKG